MTSMLSESMRLPPASIRLLFIEKLAEFDSPLSSTAISPVTLMLRAINDWAASHDRMLAIAALFASTRLAGWEVVIFGCEAHPTRSMLPVTESHAILFFQI